MRPFVMSLLVTAVGDARKTPKNRNLVFNASFRYGLELSGNLPAYAEKAASGDSSFGGWLLSGEATNDLFSLLGQLLDAVDKRVRGRHPDLGKLPEDEPSAYDHAALMAVGQTFCHAAGVRRAKFPAIAEAMASTKRFDAREMQERFVTNYFGNVLQDFFDASQIRAEFASLPADTEDSLRKEEATSITKAVFAPLGKSRDLVNADDLLQEIQEMIARVWLAEKALDD
jgi:hypothetical protein